MEKKETHHSDPEHIGSIIEQWFRRFELIAKEDSFIHGLTKDKLYPVECVDIRNRQIGVDGDGGLWEWFDFDDVPDYFEIRIREA